MASLVAEKVANEVLETLGNGEIPNIEKIAIKNGYAESSARAGTVQLSKTYQDIMARNKEITLKRLQLQLNRNQRAISGKKLKGEAYDTLIKAQDTLIKNMQLLTGGKTGDEAQGSSQPIVLLQYFNATQNNLTVNNTKEIAQDTEKQGESMA